jgi:hypothetical protein
LNWEFQQLPWYWGFQTFFLSFIVVLGKGTLWYLQRSLKYTKYIITEFTPSTILLYPPHSQNSFNWYLFSTYIPVYTVFVHIYPLTPCTHPLICPTGINPPPGKICSSLFLWFCKRKEKEMTFFACLR